MMQYIQGSHNPGPKGAEAIGEQLKFREDITLPLASENFQFLRSVGRCPPDGNISL